jgi:hypothetical protein
VVGYFAMALVFLGLSIGGMAQSGYTQHNSTDA